MTPSHTPTPDAFVRIKGCLYTTAFAEATICQQDEKIDALVAALRRLNAAVVDAVGNGQIPPVTGELLDACLAAREAIKAAS